MIRYPVMRMLCTQILGGFLGGFVAFVLLNGSMVTAQTSLQSVDRLVAREFTLVDDKGDIRAALFSSNGQPMLHLYGPGRAQLSLNSNRVEISDDATSSVAALGISKGESSLDLHTYNTETGFMVNTSRLAIINKGSVRAHLGVHEQNAQLILLDQTGREKLTLEAPATEPSSMIFRNVTPGHPYGIYAQDQAETTIWQIPGDNHSRPGAMWILWMTVPSKIKNGPRVEYYAMNAFSTKDECGEAVARRMAKGGPDGRFVTLCLPETVHPRGE